MQEKALTMSMHSLGETWTHEIDTCLVLFTDAGRVGEYRVWRRQGAWISTPCSLVVFCMVLAPGIRYIWWCLTATTAAAAAAAACCAVVQSILFVTLDILVFTWLWVSDWVDIDQRCLRSGWSYVLALFHPPIDAEGNVELCLWRR